MTGALAALIGLLGAVPSSADVRGDAMAMLAKLRQEGIASKLPEEMRSLDAAVATAEMYYQLNDSQNAERYYRLATQKGDLIQKRLLAAIQPQATPTQIPPSSPPETKPQASPAAAPTPTQESPKHETNVAPEQTTPPTPEEKEQAAQPEDALHVASDKLVGDIGTYTVQRKETLRLVAAKLGVNRAQLAAMNKLDLKSVLKEGQVLKYNNRRIIPDYKLKEGIVINIPDRMLYFYHKGKLAFSTAVALGTPTKMDNIPWHTPTGKFRIVAKAKDPTWTVPPSIQEEMRREGKEVITSIPPGPENPLGKYAMKTSLPGILIHSTTKPWSIYTYASHGCIRVYPERMESLFSMVPVNSPGEIIYRPVKAALTEDGRIFLEVHGDIYAKTKGIENEAKRLLHGMKLQDKVDWTKVHKVISRKAGVAEEITLETTEAQKAQPHQPTHSPS